MEFGFLSSGFFQTRLLSGIQSMIERSVISYGMMKIHCEGIPQPSSWISLTYDPVWLLKKHPLCKGPIEDQDPRRVAFVNVEKMDRLGVIYDRSDRIAAQATIPVYTEKNPSGLKYTNVCH